MNSSNNITIKDVAKSAKVSIASASRAINGVGRIAPSTKERILQVAKELNYVPHIGARSLITRKTEVIGVLLPDLYGEFFSELIRGIDEAARKFHYQILLSSYHNNDEDTGRAIAAMRGRVDGLLLMAPYSNLDAKWLSAITTPMVMINSKTTDPKQTNIMLDNISGAKIAINHLIKQGAKNIAHLSGLQDNLDVISRKQGYLEAISSHKILPSIFEGDFTEQSGYEAADIIIKYNQSNDNKIDAVFSANDMMAIGMICRFNEHKIKMPNDIKIIGFDDIPISKYISPSLSTIKVDMSNLGHQAFELLTKILNSDNVDNKNFCAVPELVKRETT